MLEREPVQAAVFGGARSIQHRRIPLAQRNSVVMVSIEGQQLTIAPDSALVELGIGSAALAPDLFERIWFGRGFDEASFQESAAVRAIVNRVGDGKARATFLLEARQLG